MRTAIRNRLIGYGFKTWAWSVRMRRLLAALGRPPRLRGVEHFDHSGQGSGGRPALLLRCAGRRADDDHRRRRLEEVRPPAAPDGGEGTHHLSVYLGGTTRVDLFLQQQGQTAPSARPSALCLLACRRATCRSGSGGWRPKAWPWMAACARPTRATPRSLARPIRSAMHLGDHLPPASLAPSSSARRCSGDRPRPHERGEGRHCSGELLLALVDRVSPRGGDTLALMNEAGTALPADPCSWRGCRPGRRRHGRRARGHAQHVALPRPPR